MNDLIKQHLATRDTVLQEIIQRIDWPKIVSTRNVFHDLLSCVIEQQIHYRSTKQIFAKLLAKASLEELTPDNFATFEERALTDVKLSGGKYETIVGVLDFFEQQNPDWQAMEDQEVRQLLSKIKGVGPWTIDMILMYTLERPDVLPVQDYHLRKIMTQRYPIESKRMVTQLKAIAENWVPYRSFGVKYLLTWKADKPTSP